MGLCDPFTVIHRTISTLLSSLLAQLGVMPGSTKTSFEHSSNGTSSERILGGTSFECFSGHIIQTHTIQFFLDFLLLLTGSASSPSRDATMMLTGTFSAPFLSASRPTESIRHSNVEEKCALRQRLGQISGVGGGRAHGRKEDDREETEGEGDGSRWELLDAGDSSVWSMRTAPQEEECKESGWDIDSQTAPAPQLRGFTPLPLRTGALLWSLMVGVVVPTERISPLTCSAGLVGWRPPSDVLHLWASTLFLLSRTDPAVGSHFFCSVTSSMRPTDLWSISHRVLFARQSVEDHRVRLFATL